MCNHPPTAYPASLKLLDKAQHIFPLRDFVTHVFAVTNSRAAMEQVMDVDSCMKVVIAPQGGRIGGADLKQLALPDLRRLGRFRLGR